MRGPRRSLDAHARRALLRLARGALEASVAGITGIPATGTEVDASRPAVLEHPAAAFVTLEKRSGTGHRELRGCIGTVEATRPLHETVTDMTRKAALEDPRFPPVERSELGKLRLRISVLTPLEPLDDIDALVIGRDGVQLVRGSARSVFLPQVAAEQGWEVPDLLEHLARKAGLPPDGWRDAKLWRFRSESWGEEP